MRVIESLSPRSANAPESGIVEVFNYGRGREGLIPLWAGKVTVRRRISSAGQRPMHSSQARHSTRISAAFRTCARRLRTTTPATSARP